MKSALTNAEPTLHGVRHRQLHRIVAHAVVVVEYQTLGNDMGSMVDESETKPYDDAVRMMRQLLISIMNVPASRCTIMLRAY